jgi:hypothetical protein
MPEKAIIVSAHFGRLSGGTKTRNWRGLVMLTDRIGTKERQRVATGTYCVLDSVGGVVLIDSDCPESGSVRSSREDMASEDRPVVWEEAKSNTA